MLFISPLLKISLGVDVLFTFLAIAVKYLKLKLKFYHILP